MFYLTFIFIFLLGLCFGSFLNCLIWRLHKKQSLFGRSYCPKCQKQIAWYDNLPVLSFILLGGRCRWCQKPISWQYPLVELITAVLFLIAFIINTKFPISPAIAGSRQGGDNFQFPNNFQFLISNFQTDPNFLPAQAGKLQITNFILLFRDWLIIAVMMVIFVYDLKWYEIPDKVSLPACLAVFFLNLALGGSLWNLLFSGIIGSSFFLLQFLISGGKWIGGGDIRLGLLIGLALGWPNVLVAIFLAYLIGSVVGLALIITGKKHWGEKAPLGVFLTSATVITMFWAEKILVWYWQLFI